jgi:hypothetical protein
MKKNEPPIPLRSVVCLPRWLMIGGVALSAACMLAGVVMAVYGSLTASGGALGGWLGGAFGCVIGGAGGLFGTLADWRRRLPAPLLFAQLQRDQALPFFRVFWPALAAVIVGLVLACFWDSRIVWHGLVQTGGILAFASGCQEAIRRHSNQKARAVFTLYADGMLDGADAAAIDDARKKDPKFDAAVQEFQRVAAELRRLGAN